MKKIINSLALFVFVAIFATSVFADIAPEPLKPSPTVKTKEAKPFDSTLSIQMDRNAKEAKLIVPKVMVNQLRAALDEADNSDSTAAATNNSGSMQFIVAGSLMSLAFVFGGVWFARSRQSATTKSKVVAAIAVLAAGGAISTVALANIAPPRIEMRSVTSKLFDKNLFHYNNFANGKIKVEISETATAFKLIVPRVEDDKRAE
jgi:hypothetical protein